MHIYHETKRHSTVEMATAPIYDLLQTANNRFYKNEWVTQGGRELRGRDNFKY